MSNSYLNHLAGKGKLEATPKIVAMVSPTLDGSLFRSLITTIITIIAANLIPIALSLGFPLMLFVLVMEKEEKILDLLTINGLRSRNYWLSFIFYNLIYQSINYTIFYVFGWYYIDIALFQTTSKIVFVNILFNLLGSVFLRMEFSSD